MGSFEKLHLTFPWYTFENKKNIESLLDMLDRIYVPELALRVE